VFTTSIIWAINTVLMEAVTNSEMSVNFCETARRNIPEEVIFMQHFY
jgi:hypothetical protein